MTKIRRHTFPANVLPRDIGNTIRALRQAQGMSSASLSQHTGIARETILRIENGRRPPLAETVLRLLEILLAELDDVELEDIVPSWPEADGRQVIGHGPRSRARRRRLGLSAAAVAAAAGFSEATLSRFERNAGPTPKLLKETRTPHGELQCNLASEALAKALRFTSLSDHEAFCEADHWRDWPVAAMTVESSASAHGADPRYSQIVSPSESV